VVALTEPPFDGALVNFVGSTVAVMVVVDDGVVAVGLGQNAVQARDEVGLRLPGGVQHASPRARVLPRLVRRVAVGEVPLEVSGAL
jgi:hypothetical protein